MSLNNLVVRKLPYQLGFRSAKSSAVYNDSRGAYDFALAGIPFMSGADPNNPFQRGTADFKRDQVDVGNEIGEQSLTGWWLRSQQSFHYGAGLRYDFSGEDTNAYRFDSSEGVDVWTPGLITLLKAATLDISSAASPIVHGAVDGDGEACYLMASASVLLRSTGSSSSSVAYGGTGPIQSLADDGTNYYAADATAIYKGTLTGGAGSLLWNTGDSPVVIGWAKGRLMAGIGPSVYELAGGTPPTLPDPVYTAQNEAWQWTSITEGPQAIYVAGYAGGRSSVLKLGLDTTGGLPTLTQATTVAELPTGEICHAIYGYLGSFIALGTNKGLRIGVVQTDGSITYGPLIPTPDPVYGIVGDDHFIYCSYGNGFEDGTSGLMRVDLSTQLPSNSWPYATDLRAHSAGSVTSVTHLGDSGRLVFAVAGHGSYIQETGTLEPSGWIHTPRVRFNTFFPKLYKQIAVRPGSLAGTIGVATVDQTDTVTPIVTIGTEIDHSADIAINSPQTQQEYLAIVFTLNRSNVMADTGAELRGYQLKALPGGPRPREFTIPLMCYDSELDRNGVPVGFKGWAAERLAAVEALDAAGDVILWQDLRSGEATPIEIEEIQFSMVTRPGPDNEQYGGILTVKARTVGP